MPNNTDNKTQVRWYDTSPQSKNFHKKINLVHFFAIELGTSSDYFIAKLAFFREKSPTKFNKNVTMTPKTMYIPVLYLGMC